MGSKLRRGGDTTSNGAAIDGGSGGAVVQLSPIGLRPAEAAAALGISRRKLHELTCDRGSGIPHVRLGGCLLYPLRELTDWLASKVQRAK